MAFSNIGIVARAIRGTASSRLLSLYIVSVVIAVVPFGSTSPLALSVSTCFSCLISFIAIAVAGPNPATKSLSRVALILGISTCAWVIVQSLAGHDNVLANPLWNTGDLFAQRLPGAISIEPADSVENIMFIAVPLLTFLNGLTIIRSNEDGRKAIMLLAICGTLFSLYGLLQLWFFPYSNLFLPKSAYTDSLTSTFINRNTAGCFLGIVVLLLTRQLWSYGSQLPIPLILRHLMNNQPLTIFKLRPTLVVALFLGCALTALLLTKSRGALGSTLVAVLFFVSFLSLQSPAKQKAEAGLSWRLKILRVVAILFGVLVILGVFGGRAILRIETQGTDDGRLCVLPGIIKLVKAEPYLGYGFGTFRYAFAAYRDPRCGLEWVWDRAHNFYLEGLVGLGGMSVVVLLTGAAALVISLVFGTRHRHVMRSYSILGLASLLLVGLHSLVDFPLQIPGMSAYLAAVLAATSSISLGKSAGSIAAE